MANPLSETEASISNFDGGIVPDGLADRLRNGETGSHYGWNFCGENLRYEDGLFKVDVLVFHVKQETMEDESLAGLVEIVNDKYGWD